jgi:predicted transposase YbfD/YdcC
VPADPSSSIPLGLTQLAHAEQFRPAEAPHLLAYLAAIDDPRTRAGRRHPLVVILVIAAAAVLAGARSMTAIAEWATDMPQPVLAALGARRDQLTGHRVAPGETTIRRTLARLDPEALAAAIGAWLADRGRHDRRRRAVAVDGKTLRGARRDGRQVHLLAAMDHTTRAVLANARSTVPRRSPRFPATAGRLGPGRDGDHRRRVTDPRGRCRVPGGRQAGAYLFTVKANQPTLLDRCARLAWQRVPVLDRTRDRAHGRLELRTLKAVTVNGFGFPHAAQVIQVTRKTRDLRTRRWRTMTVYAITSLTFAQASPARLADLLRGHWAIENGLHYVRDVTFAEDASQVRTGTGPHTMACLRKPRYRRAQPRRAGQPRRRPPPPRPRPQTAARHPRDHHRMNRTLRENAGALGPEGIIIGLAEQLPTAGAR